jgi:hypothetical protein
MTFTTTLSAAPSVRSIRPLAGAAARAGPERQYHDAAFSRLVEETDPSCWSIFGEVPSPVGSIDILAVYGGGEWGTVAATTAELTRQEVDGLSRLQRGRRYRRSTLLGRTGFTEDSFGQLAELQMITASADLWTRSDLPSDHIRRLVAYEVKATEFPRGVVQAGLRRAVASETWLVVPTEATADSLGPRTWDLVFRCGVGMQSSNLVILHPSTRGKLPSATVVNRITRTIFRCVD